jgi:hypothetical protein
MRGGHWRNSTNDKEGKPKHNSDAAFGTSFRINTVSVLKGAYLQKVEILNSSHDPVFLKTCK